MPKKDKTASHLLEVGNFIEQKQNSEPITFSDVSESKPSVINQYWSDVKGQGMAKRALEIAAAGEHHSLLFEPKR